MADCIVGFSAVQLMINKQWWGTGDQYAAGWVCLGSALHNIASLLVISLKCVMVEKKTDDRSWLLQRHSIDGTKLHVPDIKQAHHSQQSHPPSPSSHFFWVFISHRTHLTAAGPVLDFETNYRAVVWYLLSRFEQWGRKGLQQLGGWCGGLVILRL